MTKCVCRIIGEYRLVRADCPIHKDCFENDLKQEEEKPCSHTWWHACRHIFKHCLDCGALLPRGRKDNKMGECSNCDKNIKHTICFKSVQGV